MTISIRNPEADALAKRLAKMKGGAVTDAVIAALKQAIANGARREERFAGDREPDHGRSFANRLVPPPQAAVATFAVSSKPSAFITANVDLRVGFPLALKER